MLFITPSQRWSRMFTYTDACVPINIVETRMYGGGGGSAVPMRPNDRKNCGGPDVEVGKCDVM
jgi:hypothetical protein